MAHNQLHELHAVADRRGVDGIYRPATCGSVVIAGHSEEQSAFLGSMWCCSCLSFTTAMHAHVLSILRLLHNVRGIYRKVALGSTAAALACMQ